MVRLDNNEDGVSLPLADGVRGARPRVVLEADLAAWFVHLEVSRHPGGEAGHIHQ